jgi:hypothetical protein
VATDLGTYEMVTELHGSETDCEGQVQEIQRHVPVCHVAMTRGPSRTDGSIETTEASPNGID